jgi:hypothetical protein
MIRSKINDEDRIVRIGLLKERQHENVDTFTRMYHDDSSFVLYRWRRCLFIGIALLVISIWIGSTYVAYVHNTGPGTWQVRDFNCQQGVQALGWTVAIVSVAEGLVVVAVYMRRPSIALVVIALVAASLVVGVNLTYRLEAVNRNCQRRVIALVEVNVSIGWTCIVAAFTARCHIASRKCRRRPAFCKKKIFVGIVGLAILVGSVFLVHNTAWSAIHDREYTTAYITALGPRWTFNLQPAMMLWEVLSVSGKPTWQPIDIDTDINRLSYNVTGAFPSIGRAVRGMSQILDVDPNGYVYVCQMAEGVTANLQALGELAFLERHLNRTLVLSCLATTSRTTPCPEIYVDDGPVQPYSLYIDSDALSRATGTKVALYWPYRRSVARFKAKRGLYDDGIVPCDPRRSCRTPSIVGSDTMSVFTYLATLEESLHSVIDSDACLFDGNASAGNTNRHRFPHTIVMHSYWKRLFMWPGFYHVFKHDAHQDRRNDPNRLGALRYFRDGIVYAQKWVQLADRIETTVLNIPPTHLQNASGPIDSGEHIALMSPSLTPKPYFVFHWRSETVLDADMGSCSRRLVQAIKQVQRSGRYCAVVLATDMDWTDADDRTGSQIKTPARLSTMRRNRAQPARIQALRDVFDTGIVKIDQYLHFAHAGPLSIVDFLPLERAAVVSMCTRGPMCRRCSYRGSSQQYIEMRRRDRGFATDRTWMVGHVDDD